MKSFINGIERNMKDMFTLNIVVLLMCVVCLCCSGVFGDEVMTVMEGHSVTLHTHLTDMKRVIRIMWWAGEEDYNNFLLTIAGNRIYDVDVDDVRFRGRLLVNNQTGDLTIKNMRVKHSGLYQARIFNFDRAGTTYKNFSVTVYESPRVLDTCEVKSVSVSEGESVTLHTDVQTHRDDLILWRFGDEGLLIAKYDKEDNKISIYDDDGFRGRLKLDDQTGSLNISDVRSSDSGLYKLKINNNKQTLYKTFSVYVGGPQCSEPVVTYCVLLFLFLLVLMAISVYQCRHSTSGLRRIIASCKSTVDKRGICVVVFHCVVTVLLLVLLVLLGVVTYSYINNLDLEQMDDMSATSLAVLFGVLQMLQILTLILVFQRISLQKQRGTCLGVLCLLLLLLNVVFHTVCFMDLKQTEGVFGDEVKKTVMEGHSVTLHTDLTDMKRVIKVIWRVEEKGPNKSLVSIADNKPSYNDTEIFRDRLQVNNQTGDLTINNMRVKHSGRYQAEINYINSAGTTYKNFSVTVNEMCLCM
ncbi:uncharacterized protein LOC130548360 isoform X4 [Triplophysa rosa]|uniref:uncharacterized protein LOC130548360 isoform X4 n=1 Tax=Triplophysa rosa TaxID=992332 RepID=UPI0025462432|nr:uncharacterized protein LOC130548360 isoform X4 [Triplophysa rosa]